MAKNRRPEDLSEDELRRLLIEKRRTSRQKRLDAYRRTGRVVDLEPDLDPPSLDDYDTELTEIPEDPEQASRRARRKRLTDRLLLAVEILAVIGLVFILFNGASLIRELNQEVAAALEQPTLTPTPLITAVVLPSGHTPPTDPGNLPVTGTRVT